VLGYAVTAEAAGEKTRGGCRIDYVALILLQKQRLQKQPVTTATRPLNSSKAGQCMCFESSTHRRGSLHVGRLVIDAGSS
jgi:hypothetical protein